MDRRSFLKTSAVGGAAAATGSLAAPAVAQGRTPMVIVSTWPRDFPGLGTSAQRLATLIEDATDGAIAVEYYAAGERVGAFDVFDEVSSGNSQAFHAADYYWLGTHPVFAYVCAVPFGLTPLEQNSFIHFMGGQEIWDEVADEYGLKGWLAGNTGCQPGGWFNTEINSPEDLRGLRMRIPGIGGSMMSKLGVSVVSLPGGQIYEALVSGAIDATEWVGPWNDFYLNLHQAARYYYNPGAQEPGPALSLTMNKSWLTSLPSWQQRAIQACCHTENDRMMAEYNAMNGRYLDRLIQDHGIQMREFNEETFEAFGEASEEVFDEIRQHSDAANRMHEAFLQARREVGHWLSISEQEFAFQRNRVLGIE
ncbi:MAG: TRAP transporter substrate-binding protein [Pararhodobacter sp.]|nr:TRAP transporter substrate-binding protein [Pararhodobacter sp.]